MNVIPQLKAYARKKALLMLRDLKKPRMIWGFEDSSGQTRTRTRISDTSLLYHPEKISIGENVFVWHYTILDGSGGLSIGEGCQIGAWVGIFTHSSHLAIRLYGAHYQEVPEEDKTAFRKASVEVGKYVFVAAASKILPGVKIGDGALVSAGSVVTKDVGEFEIVSGNPAEVVGDTRRLDKRYLKDPQLFEWYNEWRENDSLV